MSTAADEPAGFMLSPQQRRIRALQRRRAAPPVAQAVLAAEGSTGEILHAALAAEVRRWEILRTGFHLHPRLRLPVQAVAAPALVWRAVEAPAGRLAAAARRAGEEDRRSLAARLEGEEMPAALLATWIAAPGGSRGCLVLTLPALCADATTLILLAEALGGGGPADGDGAMQYADIADWLNGMVTGEDAEAGRRYWRQQGLPPGTPPAAETAAAPRSLPVPLRPALRRAAGALAAGCGAERADVLLAAWRVLLWRLAGGETSAVAVAFAGRDFPALRRAPGPLERSLPLVGAVPPDLPFRDFVRATAGELRRHAEWQHSFSWEWLAADGEEPVPPFAFAAHGAGAGPLHLLRLTAGGEGFQVRLRCLEAGEALRLRLEYDGALLSAAAAGRLREELAALLAHALAAPDTAVADLECLGAGERRRLLALSAGEPARPAPAETLHGLVARQARETPDAVAVAAGPAALTYGELASRANRLARHLRRHGVRQGDLVAVALPRGLDLLVTLLAVLEAGAAYLPLDAANPPQRTAAVLADARPALALTSAAAAGRLGAFAGPRLSIDEEAAAIAALPAGPLALPVGGGDLAYVLYTSGSSGTPKGIPVPHRAVASYLSWAARHYETAGGSGAPVATVIGFDLTVTSLFVPLLSGRTVFLLGGEEDAGASLDALAAGGGWSLVKVTPAHLDVLSRRLEPAAAAGWTAALVVGGEALQGERLAVWRRLAPGMRIFNEYGPTEATVGCAVHEVPAGAPPPGPVPIGGPIAGVRLHVLDRRLRPLPLGVAGELCVGGAGLAWGYLGRPEATAERFVPDPFGGAAGERLYRTGDLVRYREDGALELLGRLDEQVKIDGYRVELGEVEAALLRHPAVAEAAAALAGSPPRLTGYVRLASPADPAAVREALRKWLPPYMVPAVVMELASLPLGERGKLDRRALPPPPMPAGALAAPPRDLLELVLVRLWEEALGVGPVGIDDSFFDLGGNSLLAVQLLARLQQRLGVDLPLSALFANSTAARLSALLRQGTSALARLRGPLVALHAGGSRRPLFCVHPTGGNVLAYAALARHLGEDQPFYAIQDPRLYADGPSEQVPPLSVEAMARTYVAALREVQPRGPYLLAGWSSGGVIAFEMARQLHAVGERVRLLALLDSGVPYFAARAGGGPAPLDEAEMLASVARILCRLLDREAPLREAGELAHLEPAARMDYMLEVSRATGFVPPDATRDQVVRLCEVFKANTQAVLDYRPPALVQTLTLIRAAEPLPPQLRSAALNGGLSDEEAYSWERLTRRSVHLYRTAGDHLTMLAGPQAAATAQVLQRCLDEVQAIREDGWGALSWGLGH